MDKVPAGQSGNCSVVNVCELIRLFPAAPPMSDRCCPMAGNQPPSKQATSALLSCHHLLKLSACRQFLLLMFIILGFIVGFSLWFAMRYLVAGIYTVAQNERAVKTSFGRA